VRPVVSCKTGGLKEVVVIGVVGLLAVHYMTPAIAISQNSPSLLVNWNCIAAKTCSVPTKLHQFPISNFRLPSPESPSDSEVP
jgi:hypothetical protein